MSYKLAVFSIQVAILKYINFLGMGLLNPHLALRWNLDW
jgi:hypothetical protein